MKRIMITSPEGYAQRLMRAFDEENKLHDFDITSQPMIRTDICADSEEFGQFIQNLWHYDYLAFSSRKAVEALSWYVRAHRMELPVKLKYCAIGKDNEALESLLGVKPAFIAEEPSPMGIVHTLGRTGGIRGRRIAVLAPQVVGMDEPNIVPDFIAALQQLGMQVDRITAYQTSAASPEMLAHTHRLLASGSIDGLLFTSGTEIKVLLRLVPEGTDVNAFFQNIDILCYGPYTASYAERLGLRVDFTSPRFGSFQELANSLKEHYRCTGCPTQNAHKEA